MPENGYPLLLLLMPLMNYSLIMLSTLNYWIIWISTFYQLLIQMDMNIHIRPIECGDEHVNLMILVVTALELMLIGILDINLEALDQALFTAVKTYRGPSAYSEPETLAVKNFIESGENVEWTAFITTHSYSQLFMTPYGYTKNLTSDYPELETLGLGFAEAVFSEYGTEYRVGSAANILYESSGSSRDWAKGEGGFKYVYTIELRDKGEHGFILPPDQIVPTARETWKGLLVVANYLIGK